MDALVESPTSKVTLQRASGAGRLACARIAGRTRLATLYQEGSAKIRLPAAAQDPLEAVLINTAGGLTGGDRFDWRVEVGAGASAVLTTQACEKIYRAASDRAEVGVRLDVGRQGRIAWLPQETILFDRAAFSRRLDLDLGDDATALVLETTVFGRLAMGETVTRGTFADRWRIRRAGKLIHAEDVRIGPDIAGSLRRPATAGGSLAVATLLLVAPDAERHLEAARAIVGGEGGVSGWPAGGTGKLLARLCCADSYSLRKQLVPLVRLLNGEAGVPKLWSI